jgi:hypothetical protein
MVLRYVLSYLFLHQPEHCCEGIFYMKLTFQLIDFELSITLRDVDGAH